MTERLKLRRKIELPIVVACHSNWLRAKHETCKSHCIGGGGGDGYCDSQLRSAPNSNLSAEIGASYFSCKTSFRHPLHANDATRATTTGQSTAIKRSLLASIYCVFWRSVLLARCWRVFGRSSVARPSRVLLLSCRNR